MISLQTPKHTENLRIQLNDEEVKVTAVDREPNLIKDETPRQAVSTPLRYSEATPNYKSEPPRGSEDSPNYISNSSAQGEQSSEILEEDITSFGR